MTLILMLWQGPATERTVRALPCSGQSTHTRMRGHGYGCSAKRSRPIPAHFHRLHFSLKHTMPRYLDKFSNHNYMSNRGAERAESSSSNSWLDSMSPDPLYTYQLLVRIPFLALRGATVRRPFPCLPCRCEGPHIARGSNLTWAGATGEV